MTPPLKRLHAYFYKSPGGAEPVRDWLMELPPEDRKNVGTDIKDVEFAWPLGKPLKESDNEQLAHRFQLR